MLTALTGARILTPYEEIERGTVVVEDGRIVAVGADVAAPEGAEAVDLSSLTLAPGFIDLHVHGGGGLSLATRDPEEVRSYARFAAAHGVTAFVASVVSDALEEGEAALQAIAQACGPVDGGATVHGVHLEGPFVNPSRRGALPEAWLHPPDAALLRRFLDAAGGSLRVLTLAPELEGARALIEEAVRGGCVVALGHSDATYEEARAAFAAGARHVTHAFNGMRPFHHREPGLVSAAIDAEDVTLELIADGVHVHPAAARLLVRARGTDGIALITDAVPPAGLPEGAFRIGGEDAALSGGSVRLPDGTLAGSAATMDGIVRGAVEAGVATLAEALTMASAVPARVLGLDGRKGRIAAGYDADLVALDAGMNVTMTFIGGRAVVDR